MFFKTYIHRIMDPMRFKRPAASHNTLYTSTASRLPLKFETKRSQTLNQHSRVTDVNNRIYYIRRLLATPDRIPNDKVPNYTKLLDLGIQCTVLKTKTNQAFKGEFPNKSLSMVVGILATFSWSVRFFTSSPPWQDTVTVYEESRHWMVHVRRTVPSGHFPQC